MSNNGLVRNIVLVALFGLGGQSAFGADTPNIPPVRDDLSAKDLDRVRNITRPTSDFTRPERFEAMQGGATTSQKLVNRDSFSHSASNLTFAQELDFKLGNALFRKLWVSSPSSTHASDGLGPLFNARACQSCHLKDGRGHPPENDTDATSMLIRLGRPAQGDEERAALAEYIAMKFPDPVYGGQIQDLAVPGLLAEGKIGIDYEEFDVVLAGGEKVSLRRPRYTIEDLNFGPLAEGITLSPRIANPMIGLGLVESIHPSDIAAHADPADLNGDGVSGRVPFARERQNGALRLGRFGWKASKPSLITQNAAAFSGDIGISSPLHPAASGDCTASQIACLSAPTGVQSRLGDQEISDEILDLVTFYTANLAVPARRRVDAQETLRGKSHFYQLGCAACHVPKFVTSRNAPHDHLRFQLIWPYSDFLLHDMGEGLADGQSVGAASGREWRTPPLWGIGLTETVSGHTFFLHDGRARNLAEAILWHGGEAQASRDGFAALEQRDRTALIAFLESL